MGKLTNRTSRDDVARHASKHETRSPRWWWCFAAVALLSGAAGCGGTDDGDTGEECPPGEPDCDRLDAPCAVDGPDPTTQGLTASTTAAGNYRIWPNGRIPYSIDASVGDTTRNRVLAAMSEWQTKTEQRVRFVKKSSTDTAFLRVLGATRPATSFVGYKPGTVSKVTLRNPEYLTVIRHELGHVLGLHHEQRRSDRSSYILVKSGNIVDTEDCKRQFNVCTDCEPIGNYNVKSVMHYRTSDLSSCRTGPVLLRKDGTAIDHNWVLTAGDLAAIAELYGPAPTFGSVSPSGPEVESEAASETPEPEQLLE